MGESSKALEYYRKGLEMRHAVYGSDAVHAHIASSYNNIGSVYRDIGEYSKTLKYYRKGLEMPQKAEKPSVLASNLGKLLYSSTQSLKTEKPSAC